MTPLPPTNSAAMPSRDEARRLAAELLLKQKKGMTPSAKTAAPARAWSLFRVKKTPPAPPVSAPAPSVPAGATVAEKSEASTGALEDFASGGQTERPAVVAAVPTTDVRATAAPVTVTAVAPATAPRRFSFLRRRRTSRAPRTASAASKSAPDTAVPQPVDRLDSFGVMKKPERVRRSALQRFVSALSHMGMGKERMLFIENTAMMLKAGLPLIDTLRTLQTETRSKPMRTLLQKILDAVENGSPLWRALDDQGFFSMHTIAMVRIGEEAGNLAENMQYLALQEEKDHELRSKVKMAMMYPTIVLVIMFIIVIILGMFVLPNLIGVLYSLNVPLPLVTRLVIHFSDFFTQHGLIAVPGSIAGFFLVLILGKYTQLKVPIQWIMFKIPGIGALARQATIARFGVILGGLLQAGVPVVEAMQSLVDVTPILGYRRLYQQMLEHITIGDSFAKSFASIRGSTKYLPPSVQQLIITGERSGSLAEIMLKVADIYDKKASETAQKLPVILEPILLIFIGGLVATIAFAVIVPIYSIVGNVGG